MQQALLWILDTAPSWTFGLILVAILRWISARGLGFFLVEIVDVQGRLAGATGVGESGDDVWHRARENEPHTPGCLASLATFLPVFALGWWVTIDLWLLLQSSHNPSPSLGEHAFASAVVVWILVLILGWIEFRERIFEWRGDFDLRTVVTLLSVLALSQLLLLMVAPFGLHLFWLTLRVLGVADEKWLTSRADGPDIRGS
jgi:hypothetical protein